VEPVEGGEVSSYLVSETVVGTQMEVRGPLGRWFVWDPAVPAPVQLVGGGVGVVPLMAMLREHDRNPARHPMRMLYSARTPGRLLHARELARRSDDRDAASSVTVIYTRTTSSAAARPPGRLTNADIRRARTPTHFTSRMLRLRPHRLR
jgi:ferredoxin-NADP reductase